jgi:hypothetical protein
MQSEKKIAVLKHVRTKKFTNRRIVQAEFFPQDRDGAEAREALRDLVARGLLDRIAIRPNEYVLQTAPVYVPNESGCCLLAAQAGEMRWLLDAPPPTRNPQDFTHYLGVTRITLDLEKAFSAQSAVELVRLVLEHDHLNPEDPPAARRRLLTEVGEGKRGGKMVCNPDFATLLQIGRARCLYLWEHETGSDSPGRVAAKKTPGFHHLVEKKLHQALFPDAPVAQVRVVAVCPNPGWREGLRRALAGKPGAAAWRLVARGDIDPSGRFLRENVFWAADREEPLPLLLTPAPAPAGV